MTRYYPSIQDLVNKQVTKIMDMDTAKDTEVKPNSLRRQTGYSYLDMVWLTLSLMQDMV